MENQNNEAAAITPVMENNNTTNTDAPKQDERATQKAQDYFKNKQHNKGGRFEGREGGRDSHRDAQTGGHGQTTPTDGYGWHSNFKNAIEANKKIHFDRLNAHGKLDQNSKATIRITPLGGLEEIGGNMMVIETQTTAIIVDVGMSFPDDDMHGVDILIPDFSYLREIKHKIAGVCITHAHEDHIGAVPYLFKEMQFPLYGTALPLGMIGNKFDEHKLQEFKKYFRAIEKRKQIKIGDITVEWIHVTHCH
jgi:ribonuclease J